MPYTLLPLKTLEAFNVNIRLREDTCTMTPLEPPHEDLSQFSPWSSEFDGEGGIITPSDISSKGTREEKQEIRHSGYRCHTSTVVLYNIQTERWLHTDSNGKIALAQDIRRITKANQWSSGYWCAAYNRFVDFAIGP